MTVPPALPPAFLSDLVEACGAEAVLTDPERTVSWASDWTGRFVAPPPVVVRPADTAAVASVVQAARRHAVALVPAGGRTGLVGGATPCDGEVVCDLGRLNQVRDVDAGSGQLTAGAGVTIEAVQHAAGHVGWAYGVDWAARATATVGGSVATDAGGLRFLKHGSTRRQLLGVEAILGNGLHVEHLPAVAKDNTGYDLASVLCGSEGTLGIITAARLALVPPRGECATAMLGFGSVAAALRASTDLRLCIPGLEAVELMLAAGVALVGTVTGLGAPLRREAPAVLLVEVSDRDDPVAALADGTESLDGVVEVAVADDARRAARLWRYREEHTVAINTLGPPHKFDVTLPAGELAGFVEEIGPIVAELRPSSRVWLFGHAADGNVHVNVTGLAPEDDEVADAVLGEVAVRGGSISAEHGIGRAKRRWMHLAHGADDLAAMVALKRAFDPDGVCNPAVLVGP